MKIGYELVWTDNAVTDLQYILDYLTVKWTKKEVQNFVRKLDKRLELIVIFPEIFPKTTKRKNVRRSVLTKQTTLYYEVGKKEITILSLFDTRQNLTKLKIEV